MISISPAPLLMEIMNTRWKYASVVKLTGWNDVYFSHLHHWSCQGTYLRSIHCGENSWVNIVCWLILSDFFSPVWLLIVIWHTYLWSPCVQDKIWHSLSINHLLLLCTSSLLLFMPLIIFLIIFIFYFACIS